MISQIQKDKAKAFLKFHTDDEILILINSWDPGSSKLIEASGLKAIGTSSMGIAASLGYPDCQKIPLDEMTAAVKRIVDKVNIPVTADIEAGYGNTAQEIVESTEKFIRTGIVGINIEDSIKLNPSLIEIEEMYNRITAIRELANSLDLHLVINARTDVFLTSSIISENLLDDAIERGNKYREAGADCIFIPDVWEEEKIKTLVNDIDSPINILANPTNGTSMPPAVKKLEELGVARVSIGSSLMKSTLTLTKKVADEFVSEGTYNSLSTALEPMSNTLEAYSMAVGKNRKE